MDVSAGDGLGYVHLVYAGAGCERMPGVGGAADGVVVAVQVPVSGDVEREGVVAEAVVGGVQHGAAGADDGQVVDDIGGSMAGVVDRGVPDRSDYVEAVQRVGVWSEPFEEAGGVFDLLGVDGGGGFSEVAAEGVEVDVEVPVAEEPSGGVVAELAGAGVDAGGLDDAAGAVASGFDRATAEFSQVVTGIGGRLARGLPGRWLRLRRCP